MNKAPLHKHVKFVAKKSAKKMGILQACLLYTSVKNRERYNFGYSERHIPFYRNLTENIWGMTAMFTHRFTDILKGLE